MRNPLLYHYYFHHCLGTIEHNQAVCPNDFCQTPCNKKENYFLEIPVITQLQNLFSQDGFYQSLQERFSRNVASGTYKDIYDGKLYKSYVENDGPLNHPVNISFTFNTDGASVLSQAMFLFGLSI